MYLLQGLRDGQLRPHRVNGQYPFLPQHKRLFSYSIIYCHHYRTSRNANASSTVIFDGPVYITTKPSLSHTYTLATTKTLAHTYETPCGASTAVRPCSAAQQCPALIDHDTPNHSRETRSTKAPPPPSPPPNQVRHQIIHSVEDIVATIML